MPSDFDARQGLKLTKEYTVGKEIGGGVQGRVLALNTADGEKTNKLLKVQACLWCLFTLGISGNTTRFVVQISDMIIMHHPSALYCCNFVPQHSADDSPCCVRR